MPDVSKTTWKEKMESPTCNFLSSEDWSDVDKTISCFNYKISDVESTDVLSYGRRAPPRPARKKLPRIIG